PPHVSQLKDQRPLVAKVLRPPSRLEPDHFVTAPSRPRRAADRPTSLHPDLGEIYGRPVELRGPRQPLIDRTDGDGEFAGVRAAPSSDRERATSSERRAEASPRPRRGIAAAGPLDVTVAAPRTGAD